MKNRHGDKWKIVGAKFMYVHAIIAALDQVLTGAQRMIVNITQYEYKMSRALIGVCEQDDQRAVSVDSMAWTSPHVLTTMTMKYPYSAADHSRQR